jgi:hypothetical protein
LLALGLGAIEDQDIETRTTRAPRERTVGSVVWGDDRKELSWMIESWLLDADANGAAASANAAVATSATATVIGRRDAVNRLSGVGISVLCLRLVGYEDIGSGPGAGVAHRPAFAG